MITRDDVLPMILSPFSLDTYGNITTVVSRYLQATRFPNDAARKNIGDYIPESKIFFVPVDSTSPFDGQYATIYITQSNLRMGGILR